MRILLTLDLNSASVLLLIDLSAAFYTIDPGILSDRLEIQSGLSGLSLTKVLLTTYCVSYNITTSKLTDVEYGVPHGSVLGSSLFSLNISPLGQIILSYGIHFYRYADDITLYVSIKADDTSQITKLETCLYAVKKYMSENFLLLISVFL